MSFAVPSSENEFEEDNQFDEEGNVSVHLEDEKMSLIDEDIGHGKRHNKTGSQSSLKQSSPQRFGDASREPVPNLNISVASSVSGVQRARKQMVSFGYFILL